MLVGVDSTKFPGAGELGAPGLLARAAELGFDGVYFRSLLELSPALDRGELDAVAVLAAELGLRVDAGIGKVNPFSTPEAPELRRLGGGDYLAAMTDMIEAAASAGIHELWSALSNYQFDLRGLFAFDRFRTDVEWDEQLRATTRFLQTLAPVLRANGTHLNLETHEEITSFELVRIVEEVGPDVLGITFDSANVVVRGEAPLAAARRVAPYVRATHLRDVALVESELGFARYLLPIGEGIVDWPALLEVLAEAAPMLSIEGIISSRAGMDVPLFDPRWAAGHPDADAAETVELFRLAREYRSRVEAGEAPGFEALRGPVAEGEPLDFLLRSAAELRRLGADPAGRAAQTTRPTDAPAGRFAPRHPSPQH